METPDPKYKHKPSEKHTLEEVLKSLQDLIRNDLSESTASAGKPETPAAEARQPDGAMPKPSEPKQRRENAPGVREDFAPVSPGSGPVNLDAVMRSLKDLIGNELNVGDEPKPASEQSGSPHNEYLSADEKIEEYIPEELAHLEDELNIGEELVVDQTDTTPPRDELSVSEEIAEASLPKELTPFDDALAFEMPPESTLTPDTPPGTTELPGEISPEPDQNIEALAPEEFTPLDEELTFEEAPAPETPPAAPSETTDLPGEISLEPTLNIEETAPEEFTPLDEVLTFEEAPTPESPATALSETRVLPEEISLEPVQHIEEPAPEEFTPLDEALTFEEPLAPEIPPAALSETTDLPGEISPELLEQSESPPPATAMSSPTPETDIAPGTQQELFLEEALPSTPEPETVVPDSAPAIATEPAPVPKPHASADKREQPVEEKQESVAEALPTIDVEESFDDKDYFSAAASGDAPPPVSESEETIALDAEITAEPEIVATPAAETTPPPALPETPAASDTPATPDKTAGEKITLEIVSDPAEEKTPDKYSVDFDLSDLTPPQTNEPELSPPAAEASAQSETPVTTAEAESTPAAESETTPPPPEPPAVETKAETPAETEPPSQTTDAAPLETPATNNLDDIPVLNEVVAPPAKRPRKAKPTPSSPETPLPAPDRAREIVVRAVAKLNVEMRKSGSAGLDTRTILRLQQLIRQELEKGGGK